jgi:hypothetical protein
MPPACVDGNKKKAYLKHFNALLQGPVAVRSSFETQEENPQ